MSPTSPASASPQYEPGISAPGATPAVRMPYFAASASMSPLGRSASVSTEEARSASADCAAGDRAAAEGVAASAADLRDVLAMQLRAGLRWSGARGPRSVRCCRRAAQPLDPAHDAAREVVGERTPQDLLLRRLREHL